MDEVLFRSGQKIENLQVQAEIVATKAKDVLVIYCQAGKAYILKFFESETSLQVRNFFKEATVKFSVLFENFKIKISELADLKSFYYALVDVFSKKWTKRDIYFGCSGLVIGLVIGVAIGLVIKKKEHVVRYMQAVQCPNYLGVESVAVVEDALAPYDCGDYDVLVNVKAASVNLIDAQICFGYGRTLRKILGKMSRQINQPVILGRDCTGVIVDIGKRVTRLDVGDEVWLTVPFWAQGTLCQTVLVPENRVSRKPKSIGFEGASSLPYAGSWALTALNQAGIDEFTAHGKRILVQGGCSPVGCVLTQLLRNWNALVTVTCYKRAVPVAKALGAADIIVLNHSSEINDSLQSANEKISLRDELLKQLKLKGDIYDVAVITTNDCVQEKDLIQFISPNGIVYSTLPPLLLSDSCGFISTYILKWWLFVRFILQKCIGLPENNFDETHLCFSTLDTLSEYVEKGQLQTVVDKIYHPHDIEMALNHIQSRQAIGSTIITYR